MARWPDETEGRRFGFKHTAYRRILQGRLPPARRRRLHIRIAERIESAFERDLDAQAAQLAVHYEEGGDVARSVEHLARASALAARRFAPREAAGYARRAIKLLAATAGGGLRTPREHQLRFELGRSLAALALPSSDAGASLERCLELSRGVRHARPERGPDGSEPEGEETAVSTAVDRLPDEEKETIHLRYFSGLSCSAIARITTTPRGTVATRVLRALNRLGEAPERPQESRQ
jgi:hypothetical protein